jgi:hypothetical protein
MCRANLANLLTSQIVNSSELANDLLDLIKLNGSAQRWKLLYRGTRDSFKSQDFHAKCDNFLKTLTIIRSTKSYIFGVYANLFWDIMGNNRGDSKSFFFSLTNPSNKPVKLRVCCIDSRSIGITGDSLFGPTFGFEKNGEKLGDRIYYLHVASDSNSNKNSYTRMSKHTSYFDNPAGLASGDYSTFFNGEIHIQVSEIEVFAFFKLNNSILPSSVVKIFIFTINYYLRFKI